jgi:hypothetical protein
VKPESTSIMRSHTGFSLITYYIVTVLAVIGIAVVSAAINEFPLYHRKLPYFKGAWINSTRTAITAHAQQTRDRPSCVGAYAIRRLVTFWDADHQRVKDIRWLRERDLIIDKLGPLDSWPVYHLYEALPPTEDLSKWFLLVEVHDNCPLWYRALPARFARLFAEPAKVTPPTTLSTDAPPPH